MMQKVTLTKTLTVEVELDAGETALRRSQVENWASFGMAGFNPIDHLIKEGKVTPVDSGWKIIASDPDFRPEAVDERLAAIKYRKRRKRT